MSRMTLKPGESRQRACRLSPLICLAFLCVTSLAPISCSSDGPAPVPWSPLPADGKCRTALVLRPGESCVHEFSYLADVRIDDSGVNAIFKEVSNRFHVDSEGTAHYGDNLSGTTLRSTLDLGDQVVSFEAGVQSDDTFYIQEASQPELPPVAEGVPNCGARTVLDAGESCALSGGNSFSVEPSGQGCFNGSICAGSRITVQEFVAERNDDGTWHIVGLP